jgi:prepilin-type N-terminal cleavage/methylation domain-containing protein
MSGRNLKNLARGFTLIELMVSMSAGLMVSLAVVALSREASSSFHEETRMAAAEMQIRTAIDRIRSDLQRASYMSTGNIWIDPAIASTNPGATTDVSGIPLTPPLYNATDLSIGALAGVRLIAGGSATGTAPGSTLNGLSPDALELAGYMSGVEELAIGGAGTTKAISAKGDPGFTNLCATGQQINLDVNSSPSIWRLVGLVAPTDATYSAANTTGGSFDQAMNNAFQPTAAAGSSFIVRITDGTGKTQYAVTCAAKAAAWNQGLPAVYLDPIITVALAGAGGTNATINPIQIVKWQIQGAIIPDPMGTTDGGGGANGAKYDLTRQYLDAYGAATTPSSTEVVAEYAVDLQFAMTVDTTTDTTGNYSGGGSPLVVYSFEDAARNGKVASDPTKLTLKSDFGPQRIRSVRVRLSTRAATPDRSQPLSAGTDYLYRYCVGATTADCVAGNPMYARTRTLISEVSLPNQARLWYY